MTGADPGPAASPAGPACRAVLPNLQLLAAPGGPLDPGSSRRAVVAGLDVTFAADFEAAAACHAAGGGGPPDGRTVPELFLGYLEVKGGGGAIFSSQGRACHSGI